MRVTWDSLAEAYRPAAVSHLRQFPLRIFIIVVLCAMLGWRSTFAFLIPWGIASLVVQLVEYGALKNFLKRPTPGRAVAYVIAADVLLAVVFGWVVVPMWAIGTPIASAAAVVLATGSVLTALMGAEGCVAAFVAAVTPHMAYMFVLPFVSDTAQDRMAPYYVVGVGLFTLVLGLVFAWSHRTFAAERAARRTAEAQTAAKSAFIAMVSHELRTPLGAILSGAADLARDTADAQIQDKGALIADAGAMMRSLLNDLLDHSKIEAGRMSVEVLDFDPKALVNDTVRFWRAGAKAKGLSLKTTGGRDLPAWLRGDPVRIRQILNNLLSNAIKFTAEGRVEVAVEARRQGEAWLLSVAVSDTGPGLTHEQLSRLFTAYDQLGADTARTFGGTGLGLSISRDLAQLMGGDLVAQAPAGGGARFVLSLPAPEGAAPAEPAPQASVPRVFAGAPTALVVDDHEVNRRVLDQILRALGLRVETAADGEAALTIASAQRFDVILMDVNMPGLDGLDATRRLRARGPNTVTPVIAVTAGVSPAEREACAAAGMTDCVEKPFEVVGLHAALARALEGQAV